MTVNPIADGFVHALAAKNRDGLVAVLSPEVDFRAMTPSRFWEESSASAVVDDVVLGKWFDENDRIDGIEAVDHDRVADRDRVGYRLRVTTPDGPFVVEQQAYYAVDDGRISWLRIMCSGFRPANGADASQ